MRYFFFVLALLALPVLGQTQTFIHVDAEDAQKPERYAARLKQEIVDTLRKDGATAAGYPAPCTLRPDPQPDAPHANKCVADPSLSLHESNMLVLDDEGWHLWIRAINFESPMRFTVQIYLVPNQAALKRFNASSRSERDRQFWQVQIVGGGLNPAYQAALSRAVKQLGASELP